MSFLFTTIADHFERFVPALRPRRHVLLCCHGYPCSPTIPTNSTLRVSGHQQRLVFGLCLLTLLNLQLPLVVRSEFFYLRGLSAQQAQPNVYPTYEKG